MFEELWEDFGVRIGSFGIGMGAWGRSVRNSRTDAAHILRISINPEGD